MKNKFMFLGLIFASALLLSGCLSGPNENPGINITNPEQAETAAPPAEPGQSNMSDLSLSINPEREATSAPTVEKETASNNEKYEMAQKYQSAVLKTNMGDIRVEFYENDSPKTVNNFLKLAADRFYDGTKFHRVIEDFMIQGGDPNSKDDNWSNDGIGGPGYAFEDELNSHKLVRGSLAMANSGPDTNGSQFFIVTAQSTPWLDSKHTNFGKVVEGMDVVEKIEKIKTNEKDHPLEDVVIKNIELIEK